MCGLRSFKDTPAVNFAMLILYLMFSLVELCALFGVGILSFLGSCFMWFFGLVERISGPTRQK